MTRGDRIIWKVIAAMLFISLLGTIAYCTLNKSGTMAVITHDGETVKKIDLQRQTSPSEWTIKLPDGAFNTIRIEPGRIRFVQSNCPRQICVNTGWLKRAGEMAVCLPHRLMISIEEKDRKGGIDALSR